jgi:sulfur-carrier protein
MIRVVLPHHLRNLTGMQREIELQVDGSATLAGVLDALEAQYPVLSGTIRDRATRQRRPFIRFFASGLDLSHEPPDAALPAQVLSGAEPLRIVGAMAGG